MTGKELVNYLILSGKVSYEDIDHPTYEEEYTRKRLGRLRYYDGEVGVRYKIFLNYFGNIYNPYKIVDKFVDLVIDNDLSEVELIKLIDNIKFLDNIGICKKDAALSTFIVTLDESKINKKAKINEFIIPIGMRHYYYLKTLNKRVSYQLNFDDKNKVCIGKMIDYDCVHEENHVKYVMYDFKNNVYDIVRNPDFNSNRSFYKQRDRDRLKLKFVKYT